MKKLSIALATLSLGLAPLLAACEKTTSEYTDALPDRKVATIELPAGQSAQGLSTGQTAAGLVGQPADLYTSTYYQARNLNAFGAFIIGLLETVTAYPPSATTDHSAVWGPFSDAQEPNEWALGIERKTDATTGAVHYEWALTGKHKSAADSAYVAVAGGAFVPSANPEQGQGWFAVDFELIRTLNPAENGRGRIAYAYEKNDTGVAVRALFEGPDATGALQQAGYAYGESSLGEHYVLFAYQGDIDDGHDGRTAKEDVLIRTRWNEGPGRADIVATHGDLADGVAHGSQCWDGTFVSTFESIEVNGTVLSSSGDAAGCAFSAEEVSQEALPTTDDVQSPFGSGAHE